MSDVVIKVENLTKEYRLGVINHGTLAKDLQAWWARKRGKEDPNSQIQGAINRAPTTGEHSGSPLHSATRHSSLVTRHDLIYALRDINFEVSQGEVLGIIGANGAGKSTLLKILSRVTSPTSGCVKIKGRIGSLLEVGTGFHPELTGRENIYLNGAILGMKKWEIDKKLDEIIDFSGVEKFIDTPVKRYSSGMYVRLAFAVAAHLDPEILVVDEVLAVGDAEFQKKCLGKMDDISKKEGRTVMFVSHNMAAVQQLCKRGIVLSKGGIVYSGNIYDAIDEYTGLTNKLKEYGKDGFVDLEKYREEFYKAKIFKKIRLLNKNDKLCESFEMLSSIKIEVELENTEKYPDADYGVVLSTHLGQRLTSFATWMSEKEKVKNPIKIQLTIPKIMFSPGTYIIYLAAVDPKDNSYIDKITNAVSFNIESTDVFKTGKQYGDNFGLILPEGELLLKNE
ncbi:MAG TPA: ABC transporter ATP-binding protein [bacterium]|nr:ABC transporter ATP-binding protein [bacterium]